MVSVLGAGHVKAMTACVIWRVTGPIGFCQRVLQVLLELGVFPNKITVSAEGELEPVT